MPQMSPMLWFNLYLYFFFNLIFIMMMIYYLSMFKFIKSNSLNYNLNNFKFKW